MAQATIVTNPPTHSPEPNPSVFQVVLIQYIDGLSNKKKSHTKKFIANCLRASNASNLTAKEDFNKTLNGLASVNPMPSAIIWAALSLVIKLPTNVHKAHGLYQGANCYIELFKTIQKELKSLKVEIECMSEYEELYGDSEKMHDILCDSYICILQFWSTIEKQCKESSTKSFLKQTFLVNTDKLNKIIEEMKRNSEDLAVLAWIIGDRLAKGAHEDAQAEWEMAKLERVESQKEHEAASEFCKQQWHKQQDDHYRKFCAWLCSQEPNGFNTSWHNANVNNHARNTCQWLLADSDYIAWKEAHSTASNLMPASILRVHGPLGSGKTFLCLYTIQDVQDTYPDAVIIYHFLQFDTHNKDDCHQQVSEELYSKTWSNPFTPNNIQQVIKILVKDLTLLKIFFFIDGLDEELDYNTTNLDPHATDSTSRWKKVSLVLQFIISLMEAFPHTTHLWCSSQNRPQIHGAFSKHMTSVLDIKEKARGDVTFYFLEQLSDLEEMEISERQKKEVMSELTKHVHHFLHYVTIVKSPCLYSEVFALIAFTHRPLLVKEIQEAKTVDNRWVVQSDKGGEPVEKHRFLIYSAKYWDKHLDDLSVLKSPDLMKDRVRAFMMSPNFQTCIQVQSLWANDDKTVDCEKDNLCESICTSGNKLKILRLQSHDHISKGLTFLCEHWTLNNDSTPLLNRQQTIQTDEMTTNWLAYVQDEFSLHIGTQIFILNKDGYYMPAVGVGKAVASLKPLTASKECLKAENSSHGLDWERTDADAEQEGEDKSEDGDDNKDKYSDNVFEDDIIIPWAGPESEVDSDPDFSERMNEVESNETDEDSEDEDEDEDDGDSEDEDDKVLLKFRIGGGHLWTGEKQDGKVSFRVKVLKVESGTANGKDLENKDDQVSVQFKVEGENNKINEGGSSSKDEKVSLEVKVEVEQETDSESDDDIPLSAIFGYGRLHDDDDDCLWDTASMLLDGLATWLQNRSFCGFPGQHVFLQKTPTLDSAHICMWLVSKLNIDLKTRRITTPLDLHSCNIQLKVYHVSLFNPNQGISDDSVPPVLVPKKPYSYPRWHKIASTLSRVIVGSDVRPAKERAEDEEHNIEIYYGHCFGVKGSTLSLPIGCYLQKADLGDWVKSKDCSELLEDQGIG
ncbi:hypothetical protein IW262DRAFT_1296335 [Armillaria fumosa]|nr:hypothetical protein IW262DRAFT_1296335 [Armillaria fumosa]